MVAYDHVPVFQIATNSASTACHPGRHDGTGELPAGSLWKASATDTASHAAPGVPSVAAPSSFALGSKSGRRNAHAEQSILVFDTRVSCKHRIRACAEAPAYAYIGNHRGDERLDSLMGSFAKRLP